MNIAMTRSRSFGFAGVGILILLIAIAIILFVLVGMPSGPATPPAGTTTTPGAANTTWQQKNPAAAPATQGVQGGGYLGAVARGKRNLEGGISAISAVELARLGSIYHLENNRYPQSVDDLGPDATVLKDQWGTPLFFTMGKDETTGRAVMLVQSAGPDGIANNEDDLVLEQPMPL